MIIAILWAIAGLIVLYVGYVSWCHTYWKRKGVYTLHSTFLLGSLGPTILRKKTLSDNLLDLYKEAVSKNLKYAGFYMGTVPEYLIVDKDLVREVTVKQFDHFTDRQPFARRNVDDLLARSLLSLKGDDWRKMRHNLSPAFTGSKLRGMTELMVQIGVQFAKFVHDRPNPDEPLDMKVTFRRFAADNIATTAFGTPSNSLQDSNSEFFVKGTSLMDFTGKRRLVILGYTLAPKLMQMLKIPFIPVDLKDFFTKIITQTIKYRTENNKSRPDMVQLLLDEREAQIKRCKENNKPVDPDTILTDLDIAAQAFTFFLAGFETVSALASIVCLVIAGEKSVQEKLRVEVDEAFAKSENGRLTYDAIQGLKYLDMVIQEVQRLIPVAAFGDRLCTKDLHLPEYGVTFKEGDIVGIPFYAFQIDKRFYEDPEQFIPERFSEENKAKVAPYTYMPFGVGPRSCIGNRFGLLELKIALAYTLGFFELELNSPEQYPIKLDRKKIDNAPIGGFLLKLKSREDPVLDPNTL